MKLKFQRRKRNEKKEGRVERVGNYTTIFLLFFCNIVCNSRVVGRKEDNNILVKS